MQITVIGGGGFIGARVVANLKSGGNEVHVASSADGTGISPSSGLLPDEFSFPDGTQSVIYLAQSPHFRAMPEQASHLLAVNCLSVVRAAVAARRAGVQRFVYVSTGTVYAPSFAALPENATLNRSNWYALSKIQGEECIQLFRNDFDVVVCRPFAVYGEGQEGRLIPNLVRSVKHQQGITLQPAQRGERDGGLRLSLCHVDDAAASLAKMVLEGGIPLVNLAGGEHFSVEEIACMIGRKLGLEPNLAMAENPREGDLVSDPKAFSSFWRQGMVPFDKGLDRVLASLG
jgi:UDP-glucose 4-epimerase